MATTTALRSTLSSEETAHSSTTRNLSPSEVAGEGDYPCATRPLSLCCPPKDEVRVVEDARAACLWDFHGYCI